LPWIDNGQQYTRPTDAQRARFAQPDTKTGLLVLLGRDDLRARTFVFRFDNM
jgi:hypothetical protein